jgi:hypothetical protein
LNFEFKKGHSGGANCFLQGESRENSMSYVCSIRQIITLIYGFDNQEFFYLTEQHKASLFVTNFLTPSIQPTGAHL